MKSRIGIALGSAHLVLVTLGAAQIDAGAIGSYYGKLSGSSSNYAFFAPTVGSPTRATFEITDEKGTVRREALDETNRELSLRIGNILDVFEDEMPDDETRRTLAASWVSYMMTRHPESRKVGLVVDYYDVPTMKEFRDGKAPYWKSLYRAVFKRKG